MASSNGSVSNPELSNNTSGMFVVIWGIDRSLNLINCISEPTPSTTQVSLVYFSGVILPMKYTIIPLVKATEFPLVYVDFPRISASTSIEVFSSMSAIMNLPNLLGSVLL